MSDKCKIDKSVLDMDVEIVDANVISHPAVILLENKISDMIEIKSRINTRRHSLYSKEVVELFNKEFAELNDALRILVNELRVKEDKNNEQGWVDTNICMPIAHKTGSWDGKNSDQVVAEDEHGKRYLAHYCEGILDGEKFKDWYDNNDYLIDRKIVKWLPIPD